MPAETFIHNYQGRAPSEWTNDSQRLILEHFDGIRYSPSYIYRYALPFSPSSSWLREFYTAELTQTVKVVKGLPTEWGACHRKVLFEDSPEALACREDVVAVGTGSGLIIILDAITGNRRSVLSGHTRSVASLAFSSDGVFLVSGGRDNGTKLWDTQTGGVVKTLWGGISGVFSVSISSDNAAIASGYMDGVIRLWDVGTGAHRRVEGQRKPTFVTFSPTDPRHLISADGTVRQWDISGRRWNMYISSRQVGPTYDGDHVAFSSDGTRFVTVTGRVATIWNSGSGEFIAELRVVDGRVSRCCFSPDGGSIASTDGYNIHVWDLTGSTPRLIETFVEHARHITSLAFSSSIISASEDHSVKFLRVSAPHTDPAANHSKPTSPLPAAIGSVSLQPEDGIVFSSDSSGVVRMWDIETGICKATFETPARNLDRGNVRLINSRLIVVWNERQRSGPGGEIRIWDIGKGGHIQTGDTFFFHPIMDLKISGDGSKVFILSEESLRAHSIQTGKTAGVVRLGYTPLSGSLTVDGSRVWVQSGSKSHEITVQGWEFRTPSSPHILLSPDEPHLGFAGGTKRWNSGLSAVVDTATGREVFRLPEGYANPPCSQWEGHYLVAGYESGEVLILDFNHLFPR